MDINEMVVIHEQNKKAYAVAKYDHYTSQPFPPIGPYFRVEWIGCADQLNVENTVDLVRALEVLMGNIECKARLDVIFPVDYVSKNKNFKE